MNSSTGLTPQILAVDLDGTLLRSNMLHETFWSALATDWRTPFVAARRLATGRAALKDALAQRARVDVACLPYDPAVIDYVRAWRAKGGRTALVTATNQRLADEIAAHLGIFDEAFGSDATRNLKGRHKAAFLVDRYGRGNFAYMGDHPADIAVWREAGHSVVRSNSRTLRSRAAALHDRHEFLDGPGVDLAGYVKAMRPHQWLKNALIFLALIAGHKFGIDTVARALVAFASFSLIASSVYLLNDLLDLSADRAHARKRRRPFASGRIAVEHGLPLMLSLLVVGGGLAALLGWRFLAVMAVYGVTTTAYSLWFKRHTIIDVCVLAALYTIRVVAGGVATDTPLSVWLLAFSLFFFFSLAAVKRQIELVDAAKADKLKITGRGYHRDDLPIVAQMATASGHVAVLVMVLYVNSEAVTKLYRHPEFLWGIAPVLLFWLSRVTLIAHRGEMHDDPVVFAVKDRMSMVCGALILLFAVAGAVL